MNAGRKSLHPTQVRLLQVLGEQEEARPSLRQLAALIGISSPNTIAHHLRQLVRKGHLLPRDDGSYEVVAEPADDVIVLPVYGNAACGNEEFFADGNVEDRIPVPTRVLRAKADYFLVRARGDSMEPAIHDRDLLLVQPAETADTGHTVVVALGDGVFAKQLVHGRQETFLRSLNPAYKPKPVDGGQHFRVLGIVRGVLRSRMD